MQIRSLPSSFFGLRRSSPKNHPPLSSALARKSVDCPKPTLAPLAFTDDCAPPTIMVAHYPHKPMRPRAGHGIASVLDAQIQTREGAGQELAQLLGRESDEAPGDGRVRHRTLRLALGQDLEGVGVAPGGHAARDGGQGVAIEGIARGGEGEARQGEFVAVDGASPEPAQWDPAATESDLARLRTGADGRAAGVGQPLGAAQLGRSPSIIAEMTWRPVFPDVLSM